MDVENIVAAQTTTRVVRASDARRGLLQGMDAAADAVGCTLGPRGRTVLIQRSEGPPLLTKDGVTVSRAVNLRDPLERMGAQMLLEAAVRTNDAAGDGTTTATVLAHALVREGNRLIEAGHPSRELCEGIEAAAALVDRELTSLSSPLDGTALAKVATVSANGDAALGALVAEAVVRVGPEGAVAVEDAPGTSTSLEVLDGMRFPCGYASSYFVTHGARMVADYEGARVLVTDMRLSGMRELLPLLEWCASTRSPLLILVADVEGEALQALVLNRSKASLPVVAVRAPREAVGREELLQDVCAMTGAKLVSASTGTGLSSAVEALGTAARVVVGERWTTLVGSGVGYVDEHVDELRERAADVTAPGESVRRLRERIARLAAGAAVVRVGGATELEVVERRHRVEDALNAARAASEDGVLPGGGAALATASRALQGFTVPAGAARQVGVSVVAAACQAPIRRIVSNAGASPDVVIDRLAATPGAVYDAITGTYVDPMASGILDPARATRAALRNAVSVATAFLSLDTAICEDPGQR